MTHARHVGETIEHLGNTHLGTVRLFNTEITRRECTRDAVLNGRGFHDLVNVGHVDDVFVILGRTPRTVVDLSHHLLLHLLDQFIEIITKQIVEEGTRQVDALVEIGITIIRRFPAKIGLDQFVGHVTQQVQFLGQRFAVGKQVVVQHIQSEFALLPATSFLVHVHRSVRDRCSDVTQSVLLGHVLVGVNNGSL